MSNIKNKHFTNNKINTIIYGNKGGKCMNNTQNEKIKLCIPSKRILEADFSIRSSKAENWFYYHRFYNDDFMAYVVYDESKHTLISSDRYLKPCGLRLEMCYADFLNWINNNDLVLKNVESIRKDNMISLFTYLKDKVSTKEEVILNNLYSLKKLVKTNVYVIGNKQFDEYYYNGNYYVRLLNNDSYTWITIDSIKWKIDKENNRIISNHIFTSLPYFLDYTPDEYDNYINTILYKEMTYHPEKYLSDNIVDILKTKMLLLKNKEYLLTSYDDSKSPFIQKTMKRIK